MIAEVKKFLIASDTHHGLVILSNSCTPGLVLRSRKYCQPLPSSINTTTENNKDPIRVF